MKILVIIILLFSNHLFSQELETRILNVENGLTLQRTVPIGDEIVKRNIHTTLKEYKVSGISVAVIHKGKLDWAKAYGNLERDKKDLVTEETLFQCASIGKVITSLAVLNLVMKGSIVSDWRKSLYL